MREVSYEEILDVLKYVREVCKNKQSCGECPFYNIRHEKCGFEKDIPSNWAFVGERKKIIFD